MLHQLIKKIVVYIVLIAVVSFFIGLAYISYLENKTDSLKQKRDELTKIKNELFLENEKMQEKLFFLFTQVNSFAIIQSENSQS